MGNAFATSFGLTIVVAAKVLNTVATDVLIKDRLFEYSGPRWVSLPTLMEEKALEVAVELKEEHGFINTIVKTRESIVTTSLNIFIILFNQISVNVHSMYVFNYYIKLSTYDTLDNLHHHFRYLTHQWRRHFKFLFCFFGVQQRLKSDVLLEFPDNSCCGHINPVTSFRDCTAWGCVNVCVNVTPSGALWFSPPSQQRLYIYIYSSEWYINHSQKISQRAPFLRTLF